MQMDSRANWPLFLFLRLTSLQGSLYRKVTIETAPIRDDPLQARTTRLSGTNPYACRPATMQTHTCNLVFLVIQCHCVYVSALLPRILGVGCTRKAPKSPSLPWLLSSTRRKHIPGFRILNLPDLMPFYQVVPIFLRANKSRAMRLRSPLFLSTMSPAQHPSLAFSYPHR